MGVTPVINVLCWPHEMFYAILALTAITMYAQIQSVAHINKCGKNAGREYKVEERTMKVIQVISYHAPTCNHAVAVLSHSL